MPKPSHVKKNTDTSKRKKKIKIRQWNESDLSEQLNPTCYPHKPTAADMPRKPVEIFQLFFDTITIGHLTKETVSYAIHRGHHTFTLSSAEMKAFLGILIVSGYNSLPRRRMYWENESDVRNELIANSMRRDRFEEIFRYFHAADNNNLDSNDRYAKVQPFLSLMNERFMKYGAPFGPTNISIDESMIPYYGRHPTKQFIRGKPIRWGYKAWVVADPLGYTFYINLYQGQGKSKSIYKDEFGLGGAVVLDALDKLESNFSNMRFLLYFDNFFTSIKLIEEIKKRGHGASGTLRSNRTENCPFTKKSEFSKNPRGHLEYYTNVDSSVVLAKWLDNGPVTVASNEHCVLPLAKTERYSVAVRKRINIQIPNLIKKYNCYMGGVDRLDQNVSLYRISIRGKKWYIPILFYLVDVAMNNSWLFARSGGYKGDSLCFRRAVAQEWLKTNRTEPKSFSRPKAIIDSKSCSTELRYDNIGHTIFKSDPMSRRRCKQCRSHTVYCCKKCNVFLHQNVRLNITKNRRIKSIEVVLCCS